MHNATHFFRNALVERNLEATLLQAFREAVPIDSSNHQDLSTIDVAGGIATHLSLDMSFHPRADAIAESSVWVMLDRFLELEVLRGPQGKVKPLLSTGPGEIIQLAQRDATLVQNVLNPEPTTFVAQHLLWPVVA